MGRRKTYRPVPKVKRPKEHLEVVVSEGTFYLRSGAPSKRVTKETPSRLKIRNLLALQMVYWRSGGSPDAEEFCKTMKISMSNYRRLIAIVKLAYDDSDGGGNSVPDTVMTRKYMLLLAINRELIDGGVMQSEFCALHKISRTTFFRYLADIEDFFANVEGFCRLAIDADYGYYRVFPYWMS